MGNIGTPEHKKLIVLLRQIRLDAGLRQEDLAHRLKRPQSFVSKYESGEGRLDLLELRQVCLAVGVELSQFIRHFEASLKNRRPKR